METFPRDLIKKYILVGLVLLIGIQIISRVFFAPLDYDEGYNLQVSLQVHANILNYSTFDTSFDPFISTGPTVLLPAALLVSQQNLLLPRLIIVCYSFLFIFLVLKYFYTSFTQKLLFLLFILILPLFYFYSSHVLGELPGFVFVFSSLLLLKKHKFFLSGVCFALAILTKSANIVAVVPFAYMLFLLLKSLLFKQRISIGIRIVLGVISPFVLWSMYGLLSLRFNLELWVTKLSLFESIARELSVPRTYLFFPRIAMFGYVFFINGFIFILFVFLVSLVFLVNRKVKDALISGISIYILVSFIQFLFLGSTLWYRHIFSAVLALFILIPLFLTRFIFPYKSRIIFIVCLFILASVLYRRFEEPKDFLSVISLEQKFTFYHEGYFPYTGPDQLLTSQIKTAKFISKSIPDNQKVSGINWWNSPEISYLSRRKIYRNPFDKKSIFLLSGVYGKLLDPEGDAEISSLDSSIVFKTEGYTLFRKR